MPRAMPHCAALRVECPHRMRLIAMCLAALGLASAAAAQPVLDERTRKMVQGLVDAGEFRSLVIGLADESDSAVFGFAPATDKSPDGQSIYEIGSVTKTFTALLLAQDVHGGHLSANATVGAMLPSMRVPENSRDKRSRCSIWQRKRPACRGFRRTLT